MSELPDGQESEEGRGHFVKWRDEETAKQRQQELLLRGGACGCAADRTEGSSMEQGSSAGVEAEKESEERGNQSLRERRDGMEQNTEGGWQVGVRPTLQQSRHPSLCDC